MLRKVLATAFAAVLTFGAMACSAEVDGEGDGEGVGVDVEAGEGEGGDD